MSYEIIEKNEYGVLVKNTTNQLDCTICKFEPIDLNICINYCGGASNKYYLTDQEAAKLETENQKPLADEIIDIQKDKINMLEDTLKKICDSQKELIDLQLENKQLKERIEMLEGLLRSEELKVKELENKTIVYDCDECMLYPCILIPISTGIKSPKNSCCNKVILKLL